MTKEKIEVEVLGHMEWNTNDYKCCQECIKSHAEQGIKEENIDCLWCQQWIEEKKSHD